MNTHGNKINPKSKQNEIILILMRISMQAQPSESTKNCVLKTAERGIKKRAAAYILQILPFLALIPSYLCPSACFFLLHASCDAQIKLNVVHLSSVTKDIGCMPLFSARVEGMTCT
jgi:hypothetical protein